MRGTGGSSESELERVLGMQMRPQDDDALDDEDLDEVLEDGELEDDEFDDEFDDELDDDLIDLDDEYDTTDEEDRHAPGHPPRRYEE